MAAGLGGSSGPTKRRANVARKSNGAATEAKPFVVEKTAENCVAADLQHEGSSPRKSDRPSQGWGDTMSAAVQSTVPVWLNAVVMVVLIFGGCCANVFALEAIIMDEPSSGALITFTQFVVIALLTLPHFLSLSAGPQSFFLKQRGVPLTSWIIYTAFFMSVNLLNNYAFAFKISVPLHIILRSGGPVASMAIGYLYNSRRYSPVQVTAVFLLTIGVVWAALADASAKGKSLDMGLSDDSASLTMTLVGFTILGLAMILSAFQGVYADRLYETHGRSHWREALFYSHALSLPFLIPSYPTLLPQLKVLCSSPTLLASYSSAVGSAASSPISNATSSILGPIATASAVSSSRSLAGTASSLLLSLPTHPILEPVLSRAPIKLVYLLLNAATQYLCIRGVHLLSAKSSSLTVTIVLNVRKLVSLMLSIYLFGNVLSGGVLLGAVVVFAAGGLYAYEGARLRKVKAAKSQ